MATTLSLIVIFLPVAFMTGYARRFIYPFGWTMAFAILVSMLVSFTLTPMLSSRFLKLADAEKDLKTKHRGFFHWIDGAYARSLQWSLAHPLAILGVTVVVLGLTVPLNWMIGRTFIPPEDMGEFTAHVDTPQGTSIEGTREIAAQVVKEIGGQEGVASHGRIIGRRPSARARSSRGRASPARSSAPGAPLATAPTWRATIGRSPGWWASWKPLPPS